MHKNVYDHIHSCIRTSFIRMYISYTLCIRTSFIRMYMIIHTLHKNFFYKKFLCKVYMYISYTLCIRTSFIRMYVYHIYIVIK